MEFVYNVNVYNCLIVWQKKVFNKFFIKQIQLWLDLSDKKLNKFSKARIEL